MKPYFTQALTSGSEVDAETQIAVKICDIGFVFCVAALLQPSITALRLAGNSEMSAPFSIVAMALLSVGYASAICLNRDHGRRNSLRDLDKTGRIVVRRLVCKRCIVAAITQKPTTHWRCCLPRFRPTGDRVSETTKPTLSFADAQRHAGIQEVRENAW